ncbi:Ig-like domain-containing protein [Herbaspirillum sp. NPDC087042]|uniref:Ig-like domain-containing protein n=1 Tax=Herbaspirillum sp. NPDC087042 TaxID=3364004 RepID=UPI00381A98DE
MRTSRSPPRSPSSTATTGDSHADQITAADLKALDITTGDSSELTAASNTAAVQAALYRLRVSADDGHEVDSHTKLQALVTDAIRAYKKIQAYAERIDTPINFPEDDTRPTATDFMAVGLQVTDGVLADDAVAVAASLLTPTINAAQIDTPVKLQELLNNWNSLFKLANGVADTPALSDTTRPAFKTLLNGVGAVITADRSDAALDLLQSSLDQQSIHAAFNRPAKLLTLLDTAQALLTLAGHPQAYAAAALPAGLTALRLADFGVITNGRSTGQVAAVTSALAMQPDTSAIDSLRKIKPLADLAIAAHDKLEAYAQDSHKPQPTEADYLAVGLVKPDAARTPLVGPDNLGAINSALATEPVNGDKASDPALLKGIIEAYQHVIDWKLRADATAPTLDDYSKIGLEGVNAQSKTLLDSAVKVLTEATIKDAAHLLEAANVAKQLAQLADGNANPNTADTALPDADRYAALGVNMGNSAKASDADGSGAALLGSVIDRKHWNDVNSVEKLQTLTNLVNKFMDSAARLPGAPLPTVDDFMQLGVDIRARNDAQKGAIIAAIGTSDIDGQGIKSVTALEARVTAAVAALNKISAYADDNTGATLGEPIVPDYLAMGVSGVNGGNLASVNAALATDQVDRTQADTQPEVQAIVAAYLKVLTLADGTRISPDPVESPALLPSEAELERIGVHVTAATDADQLRLLSSAIDAVASDKVATPGQIDQISAAAGKIVAAAGHGAAAAGTITLDDLRNLGIQNVESDSLALVQGLIGDTAIAQLNSSTRLQTAINGLLRDIKLISDYVDGNSNTNAIMGPIGQVLVPSVVNYVNAGTTGVNAGNLESINSAVKTLTSGSEVNRSTLQDITNAYNHVLQAADGTPGNLAVALTRAELIRIGVTAEQLPDPAQPDLGAHQAAIAQAKVGLLTSALDAQPADKSTVKTIDLIQTLANTVNKLVDYASNASNNSSDLQPSRGELELLGVKLLLERLDGSNPTTTLLVQSALPGLNDGDLSHLNLAQVQTMSTAAYKLRSLTATSGMVSDATRPDANARDGAGQPLPGAPLTYEELRALRMEVENQPANIKLLNEALDSQASFGLVRTIDKITALNLADIVNRVMKLAAADPTTAAAPAVNVTPDEWKKLGITTSGADAVLDATSFSAFVAALKLHQPATMDTLTELRDIAINARTALKKISDYAANTTDGVVAPTGTAGLPTLDDFRKIGVTGVDKYTDATPGRADGMAEGLFALLSALATATVGAPQAGNYGHVQEIVNSYNKLLDLADGNINLPTALPAAPDYERIGSHLGNVATRPGYLKLLNSVINPLTADKVDTPAEITALAEKVSKVLDYAGSLGATPPPAAPQREDFTGLGITGLEVDDLPAVLARLAHVDNADAAGITRLNGLQEMVSKAVQAQAKVRSYADSNGPADAPTLSDYLDMGVLMPSRSEINGYPLLMLGALNSTLAAPGVTRVHANTPQQLEAILALYHGKLLPMADSHSNTAPDKLLTLADLELLGVNTAQLRLTEPGHLRLFNDMVDNMPSAASVANVASLNTLAARAARIIAIADQAPGDMVVNASKFSAEDYQYFIGQDSPGQALDELAIYYALQSKTSHDVLSIQTTKDLMVQAPLAYAKIRHYADGIAAAPAPTGADYGTLGISDVREVSATSQPANLDALRAVLDLADINTASLNPPGKLQAIVNSYNKLLAQANGTPADTADADLAGLQDFKNIGINMLPLEALDSVRSVNAVKLLSSIIDSRSVAEIDTPAKIQAFADLANKVAHQVYGDHSQTLSVPNFVTLNITGVKDSNIDQVRNKIESLRDDGLDSNTWSKLADAVFTVTNVPSLNLVTDDNIINKAEREAGVTLTGTAGKDDTVTLRFADGTVMKSGIVTVDAHNGTQLWNWSYTLTEADWTRLGADGANNVKKSITLQSHNTKNSLDSILVTGEFFIDTVPPVFSSPIRLESDSGEPGDRISNNGKIIVPAPEAGSTWSYQIDSGNFQNGSGTSFVVPERQHTVTVRQTDAAGNSTDQILTVTVDTIAPPKSALSLKDDTGDLPNDLLTRTGIVKISGLEPGVKWQHRLGSTATWVDHDLAGPADAEHTVDLSSGADGVRRIEVRQIDAAGNISPISNELVFTLDRTGPALTLQLAQDTGANSGDGITFNGTVQVNGLEAGRNWAYQLDGGDWQAVSGSAGLSTVAMRGQKEGGTDGTRKVRVKQSDAAGNETVSSELSFTLDTIAPVFSSDIKLQFDSGKSDSDGITNNGRIVVPAPEAGASWSYRIDNGSFQSSGSSNSFEVPEGRHDITVRMTDVAGNVTERSTNVTVDTRPPTAPTLGLVNDTGDAGNSDRITSNGNVRVSGLEAGATWKYKIGASTYLPGSNTNIIDATAGADGERQVSVIQIDEAGNESPAAELILTVDRTAPALALSLLNKTGSTTAAITRDGTIKVVGLETDRSWQYQIGEGAWQTGSGTTVVVPGANTSGGSDGVKKVRVKQTDVAGNETITPQFEFTLDTTPPTKPVLALVRDTAGVAGSSVITTDTDKITSDGRVRLTNAEAGTKIEYSFDNSTWITLSGDTLDVTGSDGLKQVWMRETDVAGNVAVSDKFEFTLDTTVAKPGLRLLNDTGNTALFSDAGTDRNTRDGAVEVQGLETNATWQYKLEGGDWQNGSGNRITLPGSTGGGIDGSKRVLVRQTDKAGNASATSDLFEFILDQGAPLSPSLNKVAPVLVGGKTYSRDRSFTVTNMEADSVGEYTLGDGTWVRFTGNSFTLPGTLADKEYRVSVRQTDRAGNASAVSTEVTFTLDTVATAPTLQLNAPAGTNPAGEALTTASSFVLSGVAEKGAQVTVRNGSKVAGIVTASATDGSWSLTLNSTLEINGLRRVDGGLSAANGVYQLLTLDQVRALPTLDSAFVVDSSLPTSTGNANIFDTSRPFYRMTTASGETWYLWSIFNGDYRISRASGGDEWYREIVNAPKQTAFPDDITNWMAMNAGFATVQAELNTNGSSTHQRLLKRSDISLIGTNGPRDPHEFNATQTDLVGNTSVASATRKIRIDTFPPALLDMDASTAGIQAASTLEFTPSQLNTGINLVGNVAPPESTDIETLLVRFTAQGTHPATNQLMVGGTTLFMKDNLAQQNNQTIGTVNGLSFSYDVTGTTLTVRKTSALLALTGSEVERILEAIKIKNTAGSIDSGENFRAEVVLQDFTKQNGILSSVTSLNIVNDQPMLDMDTSLAGIQHQSKVKYSNTFTTTSLVTDVAATSSASEIRIYGARSSYYFEADNGSGVLTRLPFGTSFLGTVGGVGVRITIDDRSIATSIVRNGGGAEFSPSEIQAIIKSLRIGLYLLDYPYYFEYSLVKNGVVGPISSTYLVTDTVAPRLDQDASTAGTQTNSSRAINSIGLNEGASLFAKPIATPTDNDIKSIQLAFSGTLAVTLDKLVLGSYTLAFDTSAPDNLVQTIAGVRDVAIRYTRPTGSSTPPQLVLTKTTGDSFTGAQAKAVLEALLFKTTSSDTSARLIDITLTDQAGNTSTPARARVELDRTPPPALTMSLTNTTQVTYDVLNMRDKFGTLYPKVLSTNDGESFVVPYTDGSTPADFLSRIKGLSAAWGGQGIASGHNNLTESTRSYLGFNLPPANDAVFPFSHQGGPYTKSVALKFSVKNIDGVDSLVLSQKGSSFFSYQDIYNSSVVALTNTDSLYGLGNINLLYEKATSLPNRTPTVEIQFDSTNATVGAIMSLYDGERLLASQPLSVANVSAGKVRLTVTESLGKGLHQLVGKYAEASGDTSISNSQEFTLPDPVAQPFLSDLKVKAATGSAVKSLGTSTSNYATFIDPGVPGNAEDNGVASYENGPTFTGTLGLLGTDGNKLYTGQYLVSASMGGKLLGFTTVDPSKGSTPGAFEIKTGANLLAPGFYSDLSFTVTDITPDSPSKGQTTSVQNLALGYYWVAQRLVNAKGGAGDDEILVGSTQAGAVSTIETGGGRDIVTVGKFSNVATNLEATISDFQLGVDKVKVFLRNSDNSIGYQNISAANWQQFAPKAEQSASGSGTKLVIHLDGNVAGTDKYTLYLPTVAYNYDTNTKSIFGV